MTPPMVWGARRLDSTVGRLAVKRTSTFSIRLAFMIWTTSSG
jgi:hypothetical protein